MSEQAPASMPPLERYAISLPDAAKLLGCERARIRMDVSRGNLPSFKVYNRREHFVRLDDLIAMLDKRGYAFDAQRVRAYKAGEIQLGVAS